MILLNVKYCPGSKKFKNKFVKKLRNIIDEDTIIVCIGSANVYGDSLGPRVGSALKELNFPLTVFGTTFPYSFIYVKGKTSFTSSPIVADEKEEKQRLFKLT